MLPTTDKQVQVGKSIVQNYHFSTRVSARSAIVLDDGISVNQSVIVNKAIIDSRLRPQRAAHVEFDSEQNLVGIDAVVSAVTLPECGQ